MAIEVEARFRVEDPGALRRLDDMERLADAHLGAARGVDETDSYLDTADGALSAERWACRLRQRHGRHVLSLKGPPEEGAGGWLHRRLEVEGPATAEPVPERWPPSEALDLLDRLRGGRPLLERLALRQRRTERSVSLGGRGVGVLSLDDVIVAVAGDEVGRFDIVELELAPSLAGDESTLPALAGALASIPGLVPEPRSKLERALELAAAR